MASRSVGVLALVWAFVLAQGVYSVAIGEPYRHNQIAKFLPLTNGSHADPSIPNPAAAILRRADPEPIICSLATCGGDRCADDQKRSFDNSTVDLLTKRGQTDQGSWPDPDDYDGNMRDFMRSELQESPGSRMTTILRPSTGSEITSSEYAMFKDNFRALVVTGLWGCTSVIVISRRGVWASHIWESSLQEDEQFQRMVIEKIHEGNGGEMHRFGIDQLMNHADAGPRGVILGDGAGDLNVKVVIVTPRQHAPLKETTDNDVNVFTQNEIREDPYVNLRKPPIYETRVEQIKNDLRKTFGQNLEIRQVTYAPRVETAEQSEEMARLRRLEKEEELERVREEVKERLNDAQMMSTRGKVLLQYRPGAGCQPAGWRVFVEETGIRAQDQWNPLSGQIFNPGG